MFSPNIFRILFLFTLTRVYVYECVYLYGNVLRYQFWRSIDLELGPTLVLWIHRYYYAANIIRIASPKISKLALLREREREKESARERIQQPPLGNYTHLENYTRAIREISYANKIRLTCFNVLEMFSLDDESPISRVIFTLKYASDQRLNSR